MDLQSKTISVQVNKGKFTDQKTELKRLRTQVKEQSESIGNLERAAMTLRPSGKSRPSSVTQARFGKRAGKMTPADTMRMHVMQDGWTMTLDGFPRAAGEPTGRNDRTAAPCETQALEELTFDVNKYIP